MTEYTDSQFKDIIKNMIDYHKRGLKDAFSNNLEQYILGSIAAYQLILEILENIKIISE